MTEQKKKQVLVHCEQTFTLSLEEVCTCFGVSSDFIEEIVEEGIILPQTKSKERWEFDDEAIRLIRIVLNLNRDLGVNLAGAGLVLQLLQEIDELRDKLNLIKS